MKQTFKKPFSAPWLSDFVVNSFMADFQILYISLSFTLTTSLFWDFGKQTIPDPFQTQDALVLLYNTYNTVL